MYSVYVEEDLPFGLLGEELTIEEAKTNFLAVYEGMRAAHKAHTGEDVSYEFRFITDLSTFLANYKYIMSLAGLSKLTGINKGSYLSMFVGQGVHHLKLKIKSRRH